MDVGKSDSRKKIKFLLPEKKRAFCATYKYHGREETFYGIPCRESVQRATCVTLQKTFKKPTIRGERHGGGTYHDQEGNGQSQNLFDGHHHPARLAGETNDILYVIERRRRRRSRCVRAARVPVSFVRYAVHRRNQTFTLSAVALISFGGDCYCPRANIDRSRNVRTRPPAVITAPVFVFLRLFSFSHCSS